MNAMAAVQREVELIRRLAGEDKRIVFVSGNFNTIHPGHLRLLQFAAECGDFLVVGISNDHTDGTMVPQELRLESMRSIGLVDYTFGMADSPESIITLLQPTIVVKGREHESQSNPEQTAVESYGGKLLFSSGEMRFSSMDLLKREMAEPNFSSIILPQDFPVRHGFTKSGLRAITQRFSGLRVTVLGDLIVDEYINCDALGMSQEDPTLVVTPIQSDRFVGGAGIVAAHAGSLGAEVRYFTVAGGDAASTFAKERLEEYRVSALLLKDDSRPTTLKQRYRASGKTLLRVSHLRQHPIGRELADKLLAAVKKSLNKTDLLIFSDFNYGCLPQVLVDEVISLCKRRGVLMVADSQSSSQVGDVSRFGDMMLLTPTEREARLAVGDFDSGLVVLAEKLLKKSGAKNILMTLGAEGMIAHSMVQDAWHTDRLPAFNMAPKDPAGAGDSLLTCCSMALALGADIWQSMYLGAIAASCQVGRVGNTPLSLKDISTELVD
ncbi:PfkB family carbohydrate kinase [Herbaspirillum sp. WKF16]|uniref:PfkB family carbohydrate kinase n=1 Tax=Herbaspirillum sp. WKF16 TaxID=3028312 RepID=UPI0023A9D128|nr:PfkB family carbohydrate kinase [Herbaspirillum sp. WKF16]WDZ94300.1 PfkB family carbohydrate kinase [Herbaspirillum sp. WKF16]